MGNAVIPAKKKKPARGVKERRAIAVTLKGSPEWKEWLEGFAGHCRLDVAKLIDRALVEYAKTEGFNPDPPRR